jgi:alkanesulfonate monooxygenase SsuD/methylene tetrahydromethanopterin reductase-like flavin-dependent oxidoreductase (luciferase family)
MELTAVPGTVSSDSHRPLKLGADCFNQNTGWAAYLSAMQHADELGFDSLWTPDHVLPTPPDVSDDRPIFEAYMSLAAAAVATTNGSLGLMVTPISMRNPALIAKMTTTLDHISGGRAILGLGAGWAQEEHRQHGVEFGSGFGERFSWLRQALPVIRGMLDGERPSSPDGRYRITDAANSPLPLQRHLPILIGGNGRKVTLRLVAEFADIYNAVQQPETLSATEEALLGHCDTVGRDHREIERTVTVRQPVIRDTHEAAVAALEAIHEHNGFPPASDERMLGTPDHVAERCAEYLAHGYRHIIFQFLAPYDLETLGRIAAEVRPNLENA